jgi:hypothetical protein
MIQQWKKMIINFCVKKNKGKIDMTDIILSKDIKEKTTKRKDFVRGKDK